MCLWLFDRLATIYAWFLGIRYTTWYFDGKKTTVRVIHVRKAPWPNAIAMTIGNTVLYHGSKTDHSTMVHELVHVRQWHQYRCLFPFVYLWASIVSLVRHGNMYWNNWMEEEARRAEHDNG